MAACTRLTQSGGDSHRTLPLPASRMFIVFSLNPAMILASSGSSEMKTSPRDPCMRDANTR